MIKVHFGIYEGDVEIITFKQKEDLIDYLSELKYFNCIWLAAQNNGELIDKADGEIVVTENINKLIHAFESEFIDITSDIFIQEYKSYSAAYAAAKDMREPNPRCYDSNL